jgi:predicted transcriptional regulator
MYPESRNRMTEKIRLVVDEDADIVERLDILARQEGLSRSDMLRRAIRRLIATSPIPSYAIEPCTPADAVGK